jgi:hypothetical protein
MTYGDGLASPKTGMKSFGFWLSRSCGMRISLHHYARPTIYERYAISTTPTPPVIPER